MTARASGPLAPGPPGSVAVPVTVSTPPTGSDGAPVTSAWSCVP